MKKNNSSPLFIFLAGALAIMPSCTKTEKTVSGVALGAATGGIIGGVAGNGTGAVIGVGLGGAAGGIIGNSMGDDEKEEKRCRKEKRKEKKGYCSKKKSDRKKRCSKKKEMTEDHVASSEVTPVMELPEGETPALAEERVDLSVTSSASLDLPAHGAMAAAADEISSGEAEKLAKELEAAMAIHSPVGETPDVVEMSADPDIDDADEAD